MWHSIKTVAENNRLEASALIDFARVYHRKYGIVNRFADEPEVNSQNASALIADFNREFNKICCGTEMLITAFSSCNGWTCGNCYKQVYDTATMGEL